MGAVVARTGRRGSRAGRSLTPPSPSWRSVSRCSAWARRRGPRWPGYARRGRLRHRPEPELGDRHQLGHSRAASDRGFDGPLGVALSANGRTALVTNSLGATVTPINISGASMSRGAPIKVGSEPVAVATTARGHGLRLEFQLQFGDAHQPAHKPSDARKGDQGGAGPWSLALTPSGSILVVADSEGNSVTVVNLSSRRATTIPLGTQPQAVAVAPNGTTAYVAVASGVVPISLVQGHMGARALIAVAGGPRRYRDRARTEGPRTRRTTTTP